jgi:hypothetical protein
MRTRCPAFRTEPFEDIADAQFAADLLHVDGAALVGEAKLRAIHEQPANMGERGDDLLDHAVDENTLAPDRR